MKRYQLLFFSLSCQQETLGDFPRRAGINLESLWMGSIAGWVFLHLLGKVLLTFSSSIGSGPRPKKSMKLLIIIIRFNPSKVRMLADTPRIKATTVCLQSYRVVLLSCPEEKRRRASPSSGESHEDWLIPFRVSFWKARRSLPGSCAPKSYAQFHFPSQSFAVITILFFPPPECRAWLCWTDKNAFCAKFMVRLHREPYWVGVS